MPRTSLASTSSARWVTSRRSCGNPRDELGPDLPWAATIESYDPNDPYHRMTKDRVAEMFTEDEAEAFRKRMRRYRDEHRIDQAAAGASRSRQRQASMVHLLPEHRCQPRGKARTLMLLRFPTASPGASPASPLRTSTSAVIGRAKRSAPKCARGREWEHYWSKRTVCGRVY